MKNYQVNRSVDGRIASITSSDGTQIAPVRDVAGEIQGFTVNEPLKTDSSSSTPDPDGKLFKFGCEAIGDSFLGKLVKRFFKIYFTIVIASFILVGVLLVITLILAVIQHVVGVEIFDYIAEFFSEL